MTAEITVGVGGHVHARLDGRSVTITDQCRWALVDLARDNRQWVGIDSRLLLALADRGLIVRCDDGWTLTGDGIDVAEALLGASHE